MGGGKQGEEREGEQVGGGGEGAAPAAYLTRSFLFILFKRKQIHAMIIPKKVFTINYFIFTFLFLCVRIHRTLFKRPGCSYQVP